MFVHNKRLMYTVRVSGTNPALATLLLEQFGGPQGELAAAMRYFKQGLAEEDAGRKDMLLDIATEEMSHLEVVGTLICMLGKGGKAKLAEGLNDAEMMAGITGGSNSHTQSILYGGGPALVNSAGVPWTAAYVDTIGEPTADLRSNIAAESRAKIVYERLINMCDDPGVRDALTFLMTREIAHQKSFEKALYSIDNNFPPGKLPGDATFTDKYFNLSQGEADATGPWNDGKQWERISDVEQMASVDGGDGNASVVLTKAETKAVSAMAARLASDPGADPVTGYELGSAAPAASQTSRRKK